MKILRFATFVPLTVSLLAGCAAAADPTVGSSEEALDVASQTTLQLPIDIHVLPFRTPEECYSEAFSKIWQKVNNKWYNQRGAGAAGTIETIAACGGYRMWFANGGVIVYYKSGANEAHEVLGDILAYYKSAGEASGGFGYPLTDETATPDGIGRFNHFENGSIYWKPNLGPHGIWGAIRDRWAQGGWETNPALGYPVKNQMSVNGSDQWVSFENGVIYQKGANTCTLSGGAAAFGSLTAQEVQDKIVQQIRDQFGDDAELLGVNSFTVTDYIRDGWGAQNRRYAISVHLKYHNHIPLVPDPRGDLDLQIEIRLNGATRNVENILRDWHSHQFGIGNGTVGDKLKAKLDPQMNVPKVMKNVPDIVLDVKTQPNGDLNVYITPILGC